VVALCDVDEQKLAQAAVRHPRAKQYHDFRKMFDEAARASTRSSSARRTTPTR